MKVLIYGTRRLQDILVLKKVIKESKLKITEVITDGVSPGVNLLAEVYANKKNIPLTLFKPDYSALKKKKINYRLKDMIDYADAALLIKAKHNESDSIDELIKLSKTKKNFEVIIKEVRGD
jgi:hypothetical protein